MIENRHKEFSELSVKAQECLERPGARLVRHQLLLRLWHYPSFDRYVSWLLYRPLPQFESAEPYIVVAVVWDRLFDAQRFADPLKGITHGFSTQPTISSTQAEVPSEQLQPKLTSLGEVRLPIFLDDGSFGLDGEIFGLETVGFKAAVSLRWWGEGSTEWLSLTDWATEFRVFLDECLASRPLATTQV